MRVRERTVWKGPRAFLALPRGIVHILNKAECNGGQSHKHLDVCSAGELLITTPRKHGSMAQRPQEQIAISSLNSNEIHIRSHMLAHM